MNPPLEQQGKSWFPPEKGAILFATLVSDASKYSWGGHLHVQLDSRIFSSNSNSINSNEAQGPQHTVSNVAQGPRNSFI